MVFFKFYIRLPVPFNTFASDNGIVCKISLSHSMNDGMFQWSMQSIITTCYESDFTSHEGNNFLRLNFSLKKSDIASEFLYPSFILSCSKK